MDIDMTIDEIGEFELAPGVIVSLHCMPARIDVDPDNGRIEEIRLARSNHYGGALPPLVLSHLSSGAEGDLFRRLRDAIVREYDIAGRLAEWRQGRQAADFHDTRESRWS